MKEFLGDKVADVRLSNRLKSGAVCLVADAAGPSLAMEQAFAAANNPMLKARRILEINPQHELFSKLTAVHDQGKDSQSFKDYCICSTIRLCSWKASCPTTPSPLPIK